MKTKNHILNHMGVIFFIIFLNNYKLLNMDKQKIDVIKHTKSFHRI